MGCRVDICATRRSRTPCGLGFGGGNVVHFSLERVRPKAAAYESIRAVAGSPAGVVCVRDIAAEATAKIKLGTHEGGQKVKRLIFLAIPAGVLAVVLSLSTTNWIAPPSAAAQAQTSPKGSEAPPAPGMGRMGMMGHHMGPGMPCCCPCCGAGMGMGMHGPMMGMGMMGGGWAARDPKRAAKMMEMRAEMMKAQAAIIEKYAKELETGK
jgi:hypothetical protein